MRSTHSAHLALLLALGSVGCGRQESAAPEHRSAEQAASVEGSCAPATPLTRAASASGRRVGAAVIPAAQTNHPDYAATLSSEFTSVTAENAMKWGSLQVDPTTWDFSEADAFVAAASEARQAIKGHTLVWHEQLPGFVTEDLSRSELGKLVHKHIKETTKRYRKKIAAWDVVNEAVDSDGSLRQSIFLRIMGPEYIAKAFTWAAEYTKSDGRDAQLIYNDYGILTQNPKSDGVYALLAQLLDQGVPVDAIGFQGHIDARSAPSTEDIASNFQRFADLGLSINISELDVKLSGLAGQESEKLALQQQIYHRVVAACAQVPACDAVTVWGVSDAYSWLVGDVPLPIDAAFQRKPAYRGMVDGFSGLAPDVPGMAPNLVSSGSFETDAAGWVGFGSPMGELTDAASHTGKQAFLASGRSASWQGPAVGLTGLVQAGFEYSAEAFVSVVAADAAPVGLWLKTRCADEPEQYAEVGTTQVTSGSFSRVAGSLALPYCSLEEVTLYLQGPDAGIDILVDDVAVRQTAEPLGDELVAGSFEEGVGGWFPFGPATLALTSDAHQGASALLTGQRTATWQGPATSLTSLVTLGATYRISAMSKVSGDPSTLNLTLKSICDGAESYTPVASVTAESGVWTQLAGSYTVPLCDHLTELTLYAEGPAAGVDILLDDVSVAQRLAVPVLTPPADPNVVANGDFESGVEGWQAWSGTLATSTTTVHGGVQSLAVFGPTLGQVATSVTSAVEVGATYLVDAWVALEGAASANLHFTRKMTCGEVTTYGWVTGDSPVAAGAWVNLTGSFSVPSDCDLQELTLYLEGGNVVDPSETISVYLDDVVVAPPTNLVPNGDFEIGADGWYSWVGAVSASNAQAHSGTQSLLVTGSSVGPAAVDLKSVLEPGETYSLSYWVLLEGADSGSVHVTRSMNCGDGQGTTYGWVSGNPTWTPGQWLQLTGSFSVPVGCDMSHLQLYVEGGDLVNPSGSIDLYVDDVSVGR